MNLLFTTGWGALYMAVLFTLMGYALTKPAVRVIAIVMFGLFAADRFAVNTLEPSLALLYLAYAYTLCGVSLLLFHLTRPAIVVACMLFITATYFSLGSFGVVSWDDAGTAQEATGLIAMLMIIWKRNDGHRVLIGKSRSSVDPVQPSADSPSSNTHAIDERPKELD